MCRRRGCLTPAAFGSSAGRGDTVSSIQHVDSEIGQLRAVLMHRPGLELQRVTPRHAGRLLLRSLPWLSRARQEHDQLCHELRACGADVLYFTALLQDALEYEPARTEAIRLAVADTALGDGLRGQLRAHLEDLRPEQLAEVLIAGLTPRELKIGQGVVFELLDRHDFVLDPLPNLVFTGDSSFWIGDRVAVASLPALRRREADLATVVYRHHPRFAGSSWIYEPGLEPVDGGDVLLLAPTVVAIGVSHRTTPAGIERLTRRLFDTGLARAVLAIPIRDYGPEVRLDTLCAPISADSVLMHPGTAYTLTAHTISLRSDQLRVSRPQPFLQAAADAMEIDRLHVIDSGTDPLWEQPGQRDDGSNVLVAGPGLVLSHERNCDTNARLEAAGVRVVTVPSSELSSMRGGPRCMTCPVVREPAAEAAAASPAIGPVVLTIRGSQRPVQHVSVPGSREATQSVPDLAAVVRTTADAVAAEAGRPAEPGRAEAELASAGLEAAARPSARAAPDAEDAKGRSHEEHDQRDQGQPEQGLDDRRGQQHDHDGGDDQEQHAKHVSTVRRRPRMPPARPGRRLSGGRDLRRNVASRHIRQSSKATEPDNSPGGGG